MQYDFVGGASTAGGAGVLAISAAGGLALPSAVSLQDGTSVYYSVVEYTDATLATIAKAESGVGTLTGNSLTRSKPFVTLVDGVRSANSPAALNFGTANVRVQVAAIAGAVQVAFPARANFLSAYGSGPDFFCFGGNFGSAFDYGSTGALSAGMLYMVPVRIDSGFPWSSLAVSVATAAAGKLMSVALATMDPLNGTPGPVIAMANGLSMSATGTISASLVGATPAPGWYWACFITDGSPAIYGAEATNANPVGLGGSRAVRYVTRVKAYAPFTLGANPMAGSSGSVSYNGNGMAPLLQWK